MHGLAAVDVHIVHHVGHFKRLEVLEVRARVEEVVPIPRRVTRLVVVGIREPTVASTIQPVGVKDIEGSQEYWPLHEDLDHPWRDGIGPYGMFLCSGTDANDLPSLFLFDRVVPLERVMKSLQWEGEGLQVVVES